jgi:hypothetical protein
MQASLHALSLQSFPPYDNSLRRALRALVRESQAFELARGSRAWRIAQVASTEREPSDTLLRVTLAALCEELERLGLAGLLGGYAEAQPFLGELRAA